ncbi:hypothetical protein [Bacillus wiedmannii]|uniref:hypothetical protein n=1 Tax=Bacillus wiedmannii TaxID=1890302 RepID=UPI003D219609
MNPMIKDYIEKMNFEQIETASLTISNIENLKSKNGIVCPTRTTDLWISRNLAVMDVLGIPTVMESTTEFAIIDSLGVLLWTDNAKGTLEYIQGFVG